MHEHLVPWSPLHRTATFESDLDCAFEDLIALAAHAAHARDAWIHRIEDDRRWSLLATEEAAESLRAALRWTLQYGAREPLVVVDVERDARLVGGASGVRAPRAFVGFVLCAHDGVTMGSCGVSFDAPNAIDVQCVHLVQRVARQVELCLRMRRELCAARDALDTLGSLHERSSEHSARERAPLDSIPICAGCKAVRGDDAQWRTVEDFIASRTPLRCTQGLCPQCARKMYPEFSR
ncbi:MAG: hypothetical protein IT454_18870 [Planctomycetes bacterium]|nr:hypothetical protein [Planctomycetota bacterium]